jgi:hypothetical protein
MFAHELQVSIPKFGEIANANNKGELFAARQEAGATRRATNNFSLLLSLNRIYPNIVWITAQKNDWNDMFQYVEFDLNLLYNGSNGDFYESKLKINVLQLVKTTDFIKNAIP